MTLTAKFVREILHYEPSTGRFTWKPRVGVHASWNTKYAGRKAGSTDAHGYQVIRVNARTYKAHRVAWIYVYGGDTSDLNEIDHVNGDRLDNSISNLRHANDAQNAANAGIRRDNKSGVKGVSWHRRIGKWQAQINDNGKRRSLGYFDSVELASAAYNARAFALHGAFARY